jgi:hypothetical protein
VLAGPIQRRKYEFCSSCKRTSKSVRGKMTSKRKEYWCYFCGKSSKEVSNLIAGLEAVCICDECVQLCNEILARPKNGEVEYESWANAS